MWKNRYSDARDVFLQYTKKQYSNAIKELGSYSVDRDEDTTIDYLFLGNPENKKLHILISGTHGVEGYVEGIQLNLDKITKDGNSSLSPI